MVMPTESQQQREERVLQRLIQAREHIEQDIRATSDTMLQRIEVDAANVVTLTIITELLPIAIQQEVQAIIALHDSVWNSDTPPPGITPRKPLGAYWRGK